MLIINVNHTINNYIHYTLTPQHLHISFINSYNNKLKFKNIAYGHIIDYQSSIYILYID